MAGRGEKGLLVTTGTFTRSAREESSRDGAPPVELIDGDDLCYLLKEYELGVQTRVRQVEDVDIDPSFLSLRGNVGGGWLKVPEQGSRPCWNR